MVYKTKHAKKIMSPTTGGPMLLGPPSLREACRMTTANPMKTVAHAINDAT
jgi:hypothetical protein